MRRSTVNLAALVTGVLLVGLGFGQAPDKGNAPAKTPEAKADKDAVPSLDELLATALKNNPDIRVADAKVREADAELHRVRLTVLQKVTALRAGLEQQRASVKLAQQRAERMAGLRKSNAVGNEIVDETNATLAQEKAKLASLEYELPALLGTLPAGMARDKSADARISARQALADWMTRPVPLTAGERQAGVTDFVFPSDFWVEALAQPQRTAGGDRVRYVTVAPPQPASGVVTDKLRSALDKTVSIDSKGAPLTDVIKQLQRQAGDIPFHLVLPTEGFDQVRVNLQMTQVPLGAVLQALEDSFPDQREVGGNGALRLVVRDYGVLVTFEHLIPPGATLLHDFWKGHENRKTSGGKPPADVEGVVQATEPDTGYVTLSIGSDAGIEKGQTLEVYRLKPEPRYLGTVQVLAVQGNQSVARPTNSKHGTIQVGDRVSSKIAAKR